jgi:hypothetical protein
MVKKTAQLKGVAAYSIATVGIAMGAAPTLGVGDEVATAASADNCNDFAAALFDKGQDLFNKVEPFLKFGGVETGFQTKGGNVGGFYQVSTGAAEVFLKDALDDAYMPVIAYCVKDGNGVSRGLFNKVTNYDGGTTLIGGLVSFNKVDSKVAFLKITLETVFIESSFGVGEDGTTTVTVNEDSLPPSFE